MNSVWGEETQIDDEFPTHVVNEAPPNPLDEFDNVFDDFDDGVLEKHFIQQEGEMVSQSCTFFK